MKMKKVLALLLAVVMIFGLAACGGSDGGSSTSGEKATANENYPDSGTLNVVVGWSAGGTTDLVARKIASDMSAAGGFNNSVTNVTGSSGSIAALQVLGTTDGETAWGGMISAINTYRAMDYDEQTWQDWYCFIAAQTDYVLAVSSKSDFETIDDFVKYATENPDKLSSGSPGMGSVGHLAAVTVCNAYDITTNHVAYAGGRAAAIGVMNGEIDYVFIAYGDIYDLIQSGDLKPLAMTGEGRTVTKSDGTEITIPGLDAEKPEIAATTSKLGMWGVAIPRTTPAEQVLAFQKYFEEAVKADTYTSYCEEIGIKPVCIDGEDADKLMSECESVYVDLLESLNLTAVTGESLGIAKPDAYSWDDVDTSELIGWPVEG